ncbi:MULTISPECIES: tail protein X [unclassified Mesorhizobium]|uniref:tail protein X n=1 Tax=unclassified Mesorhizobium TaxID=325217 RepID=UPI002414DDFF|nr:MULTISPECIES: tail protein X [unclassified Mesorhizobium]MDG4854603.1 tail protein X [Mesorhizobium sp. WSM4982]MDG4916075.1 tail protein X [Mesorhizobium sp. WSM4983]
MTETVTVKTEGTSLSTLLARHYRMVFAGMVAKTFALNQDLARSGPYLPVGRTLTLMTPVEMAAEGAAARQVIDLFT